MNKADNRNSKYKEGISMATKPNDDLSLSHTRWNCKYHIVFIPKYRRKAIYGKLRADIEDKSSKTHTTDLDSEY